MRYIQFGIDEVEKINDFLKENGDKIDGNGVRMTKDNVCILYSELDEKEYIKKAIIAYIKESIVKFQSQIATEKIAEMKFQDASIKKGEKEGAKGGSNGPSYAKLAENAKNNQESLAADIHYSKELVRQLESGEFSLD